MTKLTIVALTVGTLVSYAPFNLPSHAVPSTGKLCTLSPGGVLAGGPIALGSPTATGSMTCTVQSGTNSHYGDLAHVVATGPTTPAVVAVAATFVSVPATRPLYVCTSVTENGVTYHYDYTSRTWVTVIGRACAELPWEPFGFLCGFTSLGDPTGEPNTQAGVIDGGPLVVTDEYHTTPPSGWITCTIQVGANSTHAGTDAIDPQTGPITPGIVVLPATQVSYEATEDDNVYLCTQVNFGGGALYWADSNDPLVEGEWSPSPTVGCGLAISASTPGEDEFPFDVLCPILLAIAPAVYDLICG